jgi:hypothetical protein
MSIDWISVEDDLPEHHEIVLCKTKGLRYYTAIFTKVNEMQKSLKQFGHDMPDQEFEGCFSSQERMGFMLKNVTHWCKLNSYWSKDNNVFIEES